jgi:hypothetical protein
MLDLEGITIPGLKLAESTLTLPLWLTGLVFALLVLFLILGFVRSGLVSTLVFLALIALGGAAIYAYSERERVDERRALENRLAELRTHALATGSSLACLDGGSSEAVESGCERALFAGPEGLAAAATYSSARLALLSDGLNFASKRDPGYESTFDDLRRALEQDRFGVVANVLMVNNGCTADRCDALVVLRDASRVRTNLRNKTFDSLVTRYSATWQTAAQRNGTTMTSGAPPQSAAASALTSVAPAEPAASPPAPVVAEPTPPAPPVPVAAAPSPPRRPAPPRPAQTRPAQAQPSSVQLPSPPPRVQ